MMDDSDMDKPSIALVDRKPLTVPVLPDFLKEHIEGLAFDENCHACSQA